MIKQIPETYVAFLKGRDRETPDDGGLTPISLLIGIGFAVFSAIAGPYAIVILRTSEITWSYFPICVGLPFVLLVFCNSFAKRIAGRGLRRGDLVTIAIMGLAASGLPVFLVSFVFAIIATPYYGATGENRWAEFAQPHLPKWAVPTDEKALLHYFEGLPPDAEGGMPLYAWLGPLLWWFSLFAALFFLCLCLVVVLRRHWVETERLPFPVAQIPLLLTAESRGSALPPIFRAKAFWVGCSIPFLIICFNIASYFEPGLPRIPAFSGGDLAIIPGPIRQPRGILYFPIIGFAYLVTAPVTLSIWVFYLLVAMEGSLLKVLHVGTAPDPFVIAGFEMTLWQDWGAFVAMVVLALWLARRHLANVLRQVLDRSTRSDAGELLSYPTAVFGGIAASLYLVGWFTASGMEPWVAVLCLLFAVVIFLGITRIVTQSGVHFLTTPVTSQGMVLALTGTAVPPPTLMGLALTNVWCGDVQSIFMVSAAHAARLNTLCQRRRGLALAMGISVTVSFFTTSFFPAFPGVRPRGFEPAVDPQPLLRPRRHRVQRRRRPDAAACRHGLDTPSVLRPGSDRVRGCRLPSLPGGLVAAPPGRADHCKYLDGAPDRSFRFHRLVSQDVDPAIWLGSTLRTPAPIFHRSACRFLSRRRRRWDRRPHLVFRGRTRDSARLKKRPRPLAGTRPGNRLVSGSLRSAPRAGRSAVRRGRCRPGAAGGCAPR